MAKLDYKKTFKQFYNPSAKAPEEVDVPAFNFLMIDGCDARPESEGFQQAIQALFSLSYKIKFYIKKSQGIDYGVMPLEGLWWADDMRDFDEMKKENWKWTLMIMQPEVVNEDIVAEVKKTLKPADLNAAMTQVRFASFTEGKAAQIMHIGPFADEHPNIMRLHDLIAAKGHKLSGKHHEIYLNDFRKAAPDKLKTVLRQAYN
jgi:hypothetical protein